MHNPLGSWVRSCDLRTYILWGIIQCVMTKDLQIILPANISAEQEQLIIKYLAQGRRSLTKSDWRLVLTGFDILHQAQVIAGSESTTFKQLYATHVERPFANLYIDALLQLENVSRESNALRARLARQIVKHLEQANLWQADVTGSNTFLSYCLYFWEAFALGYAFEVEIYRDLTQSGIDFQAHDIRDYRARLSAYDLQLLGQYGDIKTSLYFLHVKRGGNLPHDFYVTRFYEGNRQRTLVVMMKPQSWEQINGDTVETTLEQATKQFPTPAMVQIKGRPIVILDYNIWKRKVLNKQQGK